MVKSFIGNKKNLSKMRTRRLSAFFWATCIIAFLFILYVVTDLSFKLPSIKPAIVEPDEVSILFSYQKP